MATRVVFVVLLVSVLGCTSGRDVQKDLAVREVSTGWYDAGLQAGQNKLVPSVALKLENVSGESIDRVQLNAIFRRVGESEAWGEHFVPAIGPEGLDAGSSTKMIVLRSTLGYTGTEPRQQMLQNSAFVDARVEVYGKHGSRTWVKMGEYQIERKLLTE